MEQKTEVKTYRVHYICDFCGKGKMKLIFAEILRELKSCGYKVRAMLLNAMHYNVPQSRQRMIFIGVREDLGIEPSFPKGTTKFITAKQSLDNLVVTEIPFKVSEKVKERFKKTIPGKSIWGFGAGQVRLNPNKPASTLTKVGDASYAMFHYSEPRPLLIQEMKRIQTYFDEFIFNGTYKQVKDRIGNSVPPLFMKAIASHIRTNILGLEAKLID